MADSSLDPKPAQQQDNKPYVDRKLGALLSMAMFGRRWDSYYVYLTFDRRQLLRYVGQTGSLFDRFSQHRSAGRMGIPAFQQGGDWADLMAIWCWNDLQARAVERRLIHKFHPPDNRRCEVKGCRHYLDGTEIVPADRAAVNLVLRARHIDVR